MKTKIIHHISSDLLSEIVETQTIVRGVVVKTTSNFKML